MSGFGPGVERVETVGSVWLFDDASQRYARMPKTEAGRERPEWGDERAGALQDLVWHDFVEWHFTALRLIIVCPDGQSVSAPRLMEDVLDELWMHDVRRYLSRGPRI